MHVSKEVNKMAEEEREIGKLEAVYCEGYDDGFKKGIEMGYDIGFAEGQVDGYDEGFIDGSEDDEL
jgi:flagellar biosynthesis/type III secretory pathway protein FliH